MPSSPSRLATGTRTSVNDSSLVSWACSPIFSRLRPALEALHAALEDEREMPRCGWSPVRTAVATRSAFWPLLMKVLAPLTT